MNRQKANIKLHLLILCWLSGQFVFSQTMIKLRASQHNRGEYQFINPSDTSFVEVGHKEDMGVWYGMYYKVKTNIPDGEYNIYVNDTLELKAFIKKLQRDSTWTYFFSNGAVKRITVYEKGELVSSPTYPKIITDFAIGSVGGLWEIDNEKIESAPKNICFTAKYRSKYDLLYKIDTALCNRLRRQYNFNTKTSVILNYSYTSSYYSTLIFDLNRKTGNCVLYNIVNNKTVPVLSFKMIKITELEKIFLMEIIIDKTTFLYKKKKPGTCTIKNYKDIPKEK